MAAPPPPAPAPVEEVEEALEKLGFYSGKEDTEFSSFSTGTERAVKTWQSSIGTTEDGLMTSKLLEMLFTGRTEEDLRKASSKTSSERQIFSDMVKTQDHTLRS
ncbi:hypothetical protein ZWY2020_039009 [Hordeum vulgare]|nr:hypothetical protein ZWY2020_039009 [Hordeum vulgare]